MVVPPEAEDESLEAESDGKIKKCHRKVCEFCSPSAAKADGYIPTPPYQSTFWKILKDNGVTWTRNINPVHCKLHTEGPLNVRAQKRLLDQQEAVDVRRKSIQELLTAEQHKKGEARYEEKIALLYSQQQACEVENAELQGRVNTLQRKVEEFNDHVAQYKTCRDSVKKAESNLKKGECLVYRDFVNQVSPHYTHTDY